MYRALVATSLLACGFLAASPAAAETTPPRCIEITSLPVAPITTAGVYCLTKDLATAATSGTTIPIQANNVTIDCNDHKVGGTAAGPGTTAVGIGGSGANATVRNCNVRGFYRGVFLSGMAGSGHLVEDNRMDGNTYNAIRVDGDGSMVRRNVATATGGSTQTANAVAISVNGSVDVLGNLVAGVSANPVGAGDGTGILAAGAPAGSIGGNRIMELAGGSTGSIDGIRVTGSRAVVRGNQLDGDSGAGTGTGTGLRCDDETARAKDNNVIGFSDALLGCGSAGGNDLQP